MKPKERNLFVASKEENLKTSLDSIYPDVQEIKLASEQLKAVVRHTPLMKNINLSNTYGANIWLKREDLQVVRSYKLRGAYNKMIGLSTEAMKKGVVCASAGNHAQGVAYSCRLLDIKGTIFMPSTSPRQKVRQVKMFGKSHVDVVLIGDTFDDAYAEAAKFCKEHECTFIHPFDDLKIIEGQGTVGLEILEDTEEKIDYLLIPIGGGGLAAGVGTVFKALSPETKIIGVEPLGAPAMKRSLERGENTPMEKIDKFVDGAAVMKVGDIPFKLCQEFLEKVTLVPEGKVCSTILKLYDEEAIVVEPAGALTIAALDSLKEEIAGKNVVCIVSGSNNDITRMAEIKERSLLFEGLKHYFIVRFPQRAGALKEFLKNALGPEDDIVHFEYKKKTSKANGPAVVGIEVQHKEDFEGLLQRMKEMKINYEYLNDKEDLFEYLI